MSINNIKSKNFSDLCCMGWTNHCGPGSRKIGIVMVMIGVIWLAARLGLVDMSWMRWIYFWPVVLICFGLWLIYKGFVRRRPITNNKNMKEVWNGKDV